MPPLSPGAELTGRYQLGRPLADDGLIETWSATDRVLARGVEVEVLRADAGPDERAAFLASAAGTARLIHPGIVGAYDTGESPDGLPFLVTERSVGPTLAELLQRQGPLSPERVVIVGRQLAHALEAAHDRDTVHGAISPMTVQVNEDDRAKLTGLTGAMMRSRLAGAIPDVRDDIDACARTLIAALVGAPVSSDGTVSPRALRAGIPPALDGVLVDAQRGGTTTTAAALAAGLDHLDLSDDARPDLDGQRTPPLGSPVTPPPVRVGGSRSGAVAGIVVGLILAAAVVAAAVALFGRGATGGPSAPGGSDTTSTAPGPHGGELAIVGANSFDPFGDGTEQQPRVNAVRDGNPTTLWPTEEYTTAHFGGLKPGVGVVVLLDAAHALTQLTVTSPSHGWVCSVYVAVRPSDTLAGWGQPVASDVTVTGDVTPIGLKGTSGEAVLVWITDLGPPLADPPQPGTPYQVAIGELQVR